MRQYFPNPLIQVRCNKSAEEIASSLQLVHDLMVGINLCAAAEAIAFARYLSVDLKQFYGLVNDAAGASRIFQERGLEMIDGRNGESAPTSSTTIEAIVAPMEKAIQTARDLNCPLHLGNASLSLLLLAQRHGLGSESSASVVKVFGQ